MDRQASRPDDDPDDVEAWAPPPDEPVRLGGSIRHDEGCELVWSIADGRRGRRWREVCARLGRPSAARLLESDPEGRLARLEVAATAGLLTLHPSADGRALHGNVVTPTGVQHIALPWGEAHRILVAGSIASVAVTCRHLAALVPPGGTTTFRGVGVDGELQVGEGSVRVERVGLTRWRLSVASIGVVVEGEVDERGIPLGGQQWPLEGPAGA